MGVLAGGGSVAVAVAIIDKWQATSDTQQVRGGKWHMTCDMWHLTQDTWQMKFFLLLYLSVWFCLSWYWSYYPHASRDSVSPVCGIFFIKKYWKWQHYFFQQLGFISLENNKKQQYPPLICYKFLYFMWKLFNITNVFYHTNESNKIRRYFDKYLLQYIFFLLLK